MKKNSARPTVLWKGRVRVTSTASESQRALIPGNGSKAGTRTGQAPGRHWTRPMHWPGTGLSLARGRAGRAQAQPGPTVTVTES